MPRERIGSLGSILAPLRGNGASRRGLLFPLPARARRGSRGGGGGRATGRTESIHIIIDSAKTVTASFDFTCYDCSMQTFVPFVIR